MAYRTIEDMRKEAGNFRSIEQMRSASSDISELEKRIDTFNNNAREYFTEASSFADFDKEYKGDKASAWANNLSVWNNNFRKEAAAIKSSLSRYNLSDEGIKKITQSLDDTLALQNEALVNAGKINDAWKEIGTREQWGEWKKTTQKQTSLYPKLTDDEFNRMSDVLDAYGEMASTREYNGGGSRHDEIVEREKTRVEEMYGKDYVQYVLGEYGVTDKDSARDAISALKQDKVNADYYNLGQKFNTQFESVKGTPDFERARMEMLKDASKNALGITAIDGRGGSSDVITYNNLDEDQRAYYYYLTDKYDRDTANEYLYSQEQNAQNKIRDRAIDEIKGIDNDVGRFFAQTGIDILGGLEQFGSGVTGVANAIKGVDRYVPVGGTLVAANRLAEESSWAGKIWHNSTTTIANMLPSIAMSTIPGLGQAAFWASAAGNAYNEAINNGYSVGQARTYGTLVGTAEVYLEKLLGGISPLGGKGGMFEGVAEKMMGKVNSAFAKAAISTTANAMAEFTEEALQEVLDPFYTYFISGGVDFDAPNIEDVLYAGLLGFISAGMMEGVPNFAGAAYNDISAVKIGNAIKNNGVIGDVVAYVNTLPEEQRAKLAQNLTDNASGFKIGRTIQELGAGLSAQNVQTIEGYLFELGLPQAQAHTIAEGMAAVVNGEEASPELIAALDNPLVASAYKSLFLKGEEMVGQTVQTNDDMVNAIYRKLGVATPITEDIDNSLRNRIKENTKKYNYIMERAAKTEETKGKKSAKETVKEPPDTAETAPVAQGDEFVAKMINGLGMDDLSTKALTEGYNTYKDAMFTSPEFITPEQYALGVREAVAMARNGYTLDTLSNTDFASKLPTAQREGAWRIGRAEYEAKKNAKIEEQNAYKNKKAPKSNVKGVSYTINVDTKSFTEKQKAQVQAMGKVASATGIQVVFYDSSNPLNENMGKANGFLIGNTLFLDINATNASQKETILLTAAHELTHFIKAWNLEKYETLKDFLMDFLAEKGYDFTEFVKTELDKAKAKGITTYTEEDAIEDAVCEAMQMMLMSDDALQRISELSQKDKKLSERIKQILANIVAKLKKLLSDVVPGSDQAKILNEHIDEFKKLQDMWTKALVEASESYRSAEMQTQKLHDELLKHNYKEAPANLDKLMQMFDETRSTLTKTNIRTQYRVNMEMWKRISDSIDHTFLNEWNNLEAKDRAFDVWKSQSGYVYNEELSTMCAKGVPLFEAIDTLVKEDFFRKNGVSVVGVDEKKVMYAVLQSFGFQVPCDYCYVEQARQREGTIIDKFINGGETADGKPQLGWNEILNNAKKRMAEKGVKYKFGELTRSIADTKYTPTNAHMPAKAQNAFYEALKDIANEWAGQEVIKGTTPEDFAKLKGDLSIMAIKTIAMNPDIRYKIDADLLLSSYTTTNLKYFHPALYNLFNKQGGVNTFKTKQRPVIYAADILDDAAALKKELIKKSLTPANSKSAGGVRSQSNSDFQIYTYLDEVQRYLDMSAQGLYAQEYTKVLSKLRLFGLSNVKLNASFAPAIVSFGNDELTRANAGLDKNGNLLFDNVGGIDAGEAMSIIKYGDYSKNITGICIGVSDNQIRKLLDEPAIQLIIGFHDKKGSDGKRYGIANYFKNYADPGVNEAKDSNGKTIHLGDKFPSFSDFLDMAEKAVGSKTGKYTFTNNWTGETKTYRWNDVPRLAADMYLNKIADIGGTPAYDIEGIVDHPNYYKLLADFGLYDINGNYAPHKAVKLNVPKSVPVIENGNVKLMDTESYIKREVLRELTTMDKISTALSDNSPDGMKAQMLDGIKALKNKNVDEVTSEIRRKNREAGRMPLLSEVKYQLKDVAPVEPSSDKWSRSLTTEEVQERFPNLWNVKAESSETRHPTQVRSTVSTYEKIYNILKGEGFNGSILDASSGLGDGTKTGRAMGFNVDDIEPYPDSSYKPKYTDYSKLNKKYDVIISNAVLNVLPQEQRDALVVKMGELLNPGGRMFINVRGDDVLNASSKQFIDRDGMEVYISNTGSYQKGFTPTELKAYLEDALGDGYTVTLTKQFGKVSAIVQKAGVKTEGIKYSLKDSNGKQLTPAQAEYFKDSKVRDENGNLLVVYHGTANNFTVFDIERAGRNWGGDSRRGKGFYFARTEREAEQWTEGTRIVKAYLNLVNPLDVTKEAPEDIKREIDKYIIARRGEYSDWFPISKEQYEQNLQDSKKTYEANPAQFINQFKYDSNGKMTNGIMELLESLGYDGIIADDEFVAFHPNQIKLTTNKNPTSNDDIRYSLKDTNRPYAPTFYSKLENEITNLKDGKYSANGIVNFLMGKGVKKEEIEWSGIPEYLDGKKSVSKDELLEVAKANRMVIEDVVDTDKFPPFTEDELNEIGDDVWRIIRNSPFTEWAFEYDYFRDILNEYATSMRRMASSYLADIEEYLVDRIDDMEDEDEQEEAYDAMQNALDMMQDTFDQIDSRRHRNTQYSEYTLNGGENYREFRFVMPNSDYAAPHWGERGVLAHARTTDRLVRNEKTLFVEEVQSDLHNEGHNTGYLPKGKTRESVEDEWFESSGRSGAAYTALVDYIDESLGGVVGGKTYAGLLASRLTDEVDTDRARADKAQVVEYLEGRGVSMSEVNKRIAAYKTSKESEKQLWEDRKKIANAPFKDTYQDFAMKKMLRLAAEEDYSYIGWTTAKQQSDRWSDEYAEGYKIEYDQQIPSFMNKFGKKFGTKVEKAMLDNGEEVWAMKITEPMKESVLYEGQPLFQLKDAEDIPDRWYLATALESVASEEEIPLLKNYQAQIAEAEKLNAEYDEASAQLRETMFRKGRSQAEVDALRKKTKKLGDKLTKIDKQLLDLEKTKVLADLAKREKDKAVKKERARKNEFISELRSKDRGRDIKRKLAKKVKDLNKLLNGTKDKNVKIPLQPTARAALKAAEALFASTNKLDILYDYEGDSESLKAYKELYEAYEMMPSKTSDEAREMRHELYEIANSDEFAGIIKKRTEEIADAQGQSVRNALMELASAYKGLLKSEVAYAANAYDDGIMEYLDGLAESLAEVKVSNMTDEQLQAVYEAFQMVYTTIADSNKLFRKYQQKTLEGWFEQGAEEIKAVNTRFRDWYQSKLPANNLTQKTTGFFSSFAWNNDKPIYAAERLGSDLFKNLWWDLQEGELKYIQKAVEVYDELVAMREDTGWENTWANEKVTLKLHDGTERTYTIGHLMTLLDGARREQVAKHTGAGGVFVKSSDLAKIGQWKQGEAGTQFNLADFYEIARLLGEENLSEDWLNGNNKPSDADYKAKLAELAPMVRYAFMNQDLMSGLRGLGNEISRTLYGVDLYKEDFYIPARSEKTTLAKDADEDAKLANSIGRMNALVNSSFTKPTVKNASNPIVVEQLDDVVARHIHEMLLYYSLAIPITNFNRVFNYGVRGKEGERGGLSMRSIIRNKFGDAAVDYFTNFIADLNGGILRNDLKGLPNAMTKFKKVKTMAKLSVISQQYTSILRAAAMVDPKYFIGKPDGMSQKEAYEELKKYAPIAIIKEIGGFDVGSGRTIIDYLKQGSGDSAYKRITAKAGEYGGMGAQYMDKVGWLTIWSAVKRETRAKTNLTGEELLKEAGKRFNEVIVYTQVYDSVMSRSAFMRSKSQTAQAFTSFKGEPTTVANMYSYAIMQWARAGWKNKDAATKAWRFMSATFAASIFAAAMKALIYGMLDDDDEEKSFMEIYGEKFGSAANDELNPVKLLPFFSDLWSVGEGFSLKRPDVEIYENTIKGTTQFIKKVFSDDEITFDNILDFAGAWADLTGIPVENVIKDVMGIWNFAQRVANGADSGDFWEGFGRGFTNASESKHDRLYDAMEDQNKGALDILREGYKSDSSFETQKQLALRENNVNVRTAAYKAVIGSAYNSYVEQAVREGFDRNLVEAAVEAEKTYILAKARDAYKAFQEDKDKYKQIVKDFRARYKDVFGSESKAQDFIITLANRFRG